MQVWRFSLKKAPPSHKSKLKTWLKQKTLVSQVGRSDSSQTFRDDSSHVVSRKPPSHLACVCLPLTLLLIGCSGLVVKTFTGVWIVSCGFLSPQTQICAHWIPVTAKPPGVWPKMETSRVTVKRATSRSTTATGCASVGVSDERNGTCTWGHVLHSSIHSFFQLVPVGLRRN